MGLHSPLPQSIGEECDKCAQIIREFAENPSKPVKERTVGQNIYLEPRIPKHVIANCCGVAIITVFRMGFLVSIRGGTGLVVAKLANGDWSAPSAIALGGISGGFEIGLELTDLVIVLNSRHALDSFCKGGNVTLGGNYSVAAGPVGRQGEGDVAVRSTTAFFTYSKTKGLYAGISFVGTALIERKEANKKMYGRVIRAKELLRGDVSPPADARILYSALDFEDASSLPAPSRQPTVSSRDQPQPQPVSRMSRSSSSHSTRAKEDKQAAKPAINRAWEAVSSKFQKEEPKVKTVQSIEYQHTPAMFSVQQQRARENAASLARKDGGDVSKKPKPITRRVVEVAEPEEDDGWHKEPTGKALYAYKAKMPCDLSFKEGEIITILTRTPSQNDWWEGRLGKTGAPGIFPANFIKLL